MLKFVSFLMFLISTSVFAAYPSVSETRDVLNLSPPGSRVQLGTQLVDKTVHVLEAKYLFATQGGAKGTVSLLDLDGKPAKLPNNILITDCLVHASTTPTSTTIAATISLGTGASTIDLKAATAVGFYSGLVSCDVNASTAAARIKKTTGETTVTATIGTAPVTAGVLKVFIQYMINN